MLEKRSDITMGNQQRSIQSQILDERSETKQVALSLYFSPQLFYNLINSSNYEIGGAKCGQNFMMSVSDADEVISLTMDLGYVGHAIKKSMLNVIKKENGRERRDGTTYVKIFLLSRKGSEKIEMESLQNLSRKMVDVGSVEVQRICKFITGMGKDRMFQRQCETIDQATLSFSAISVMEDSMGGLLGGPEIMKDAWSVGLLKESIRHTEDVGDAKREFGIKITRDKEDIVHANTKVLD